MVNQPTKSPFTFYSGILLSEILIYSILSITAIVLFAIGDANGIGVFQQPDHNLLPPLIIGAIYNGLVFYVIAFLAIPAYFLERKYVFLVLSFPTIFVLSTIIKTAIHKFLIVLFYPSLGNESLEVLLIENVYFMVSILVVAGCYGFIRVALFQQVKGRIGRLQNTDHIYIQSGKKTLRFKISSIRYFAAEGNYVKVVTDSESPLIYTSMATLETLLPEELFIRVHRSYIISLLHIDKFDGRTLEVDNEQISIGQKYLESTRERLNEFV